MTQALQVVPALGVDDDATMGRRLRRLRYARGLGMNVFAGLAGISKPYLSMLERGQRQGLCDIRVIAGLAHALGMESPLELLRVLVPQWFADRTGQR